jgi:hypothetical protein
MRVEILLDPYYHPAELPWVVHAALRRNPRVVVIEVIAWIAVTGSEVVDLSRLPRHIRSALQRVQHLQRAARTVTEGTREGGLLYQVRTNALGLMSEMLKPLLPRRPRPTVAQYESALRLAVAALREHPGVSVVLQGSGAPNLNLNSPNLATDFIERYRAINEMGRRVADEHGALFVDRWDTVAPGFFLPRTNRPTKAAHAVWGHLLASELLSAGVV